MAFSTAVPAIGGAALFGAVLWSGPVQHTLADGIETLVDRVYRPALAASVRWRYLSLAAGVSMLVLTVGLVLVAASRSTSSPRPKRTSSTRR